jgi:hypothetical protein
MKRNIFIAIIVSCFLGISACATASVNYDKSTDYEIHEISYPNFIFLGKMQIEHQNYILTFLKDINNNNLPDYDDGGFFSTTTGKSYKFYIGENFLSTVDVFRHTKGVSLAKQLLSTYVSSSYIKITNKNNESFLITINDSSNDIIINDTTKRNITIEAIRESYQNDKIYTLFNKTLSGARVIIDREEYAIIDFMSKPRILYNKSFSQILEDETKQHIILLMLSLYDYNRTIANQREIPTKQEY